MITCSVALSVACLDTMEGIACMVVAWAEDLWGLVLEEVVGLEEEVLVRSLLFGEIEFYESHKPY
jgi:hypothetical protein